MMRISSKKSLFFILLWILACGTFAYKGIVRLRTSTHLEGNSVSFLAKPGMEYTVTSASPVTYTVTSLEQFDLTYTIGEVEGKTVTHPYRPVTNDPNQNPYPFYVAHGQFDTTPQLGLSVKQSSADITLESESTIYMDGNYHKVLARASTIMIVIFALVWAFFGSKMIMNAQKLYHDINEARKTSNKLGLD